MRKNIVMQLGRKINVRTAFKQNVNGEESGLVGRGGERERDEEKSGEKVGLDRIEEIQGERE